jgi:hypothetical protein
MALPLEERVQLAEALWRASTTTVRPPTRKTSSLKRVAATPNSQQERPRGERMKK